MSAERAGRAGRPGGPERVAFFLPDLSGGGAERVVVTVANAIARRGIGTDLVLAARRGPYLDEVAPEVRISDLGGRGVMASLPALARWLRRERPAALLSTLMHASVVAVLAARLSGVRVRVLLREANTVSRIERSDRRTRVLRALLPLAYRWADGAVAVSDGVARDLASIGVPPGRIRRIYNPVVGPELRARAAAPPEHPWLLDPDGPPVLLAVGSLTDQKDLPTMLRAFSRVRARRPARLLVLGEGPERTATEALARELGVADDVALPGFADNPFPAMAAARLFVLSSRWEGLPNALIQALACGCPAVATDCPSGPDEILEGGRWGPLVPPGDPDALAAAILRELEGPRDAQRARRAAERFEVERNVDAYLDALLPDRRAGPAAEPAGRPAAREPS